HDTADLDEAVRGVLESAIGYQGQKCSACSRVIVLKDIQKDFTERLKEAMASVKVGSPDDPATTMGPLIDETALHRVTHYIMLAERECELNLRGEKQGAGYFVTPTLVTNVKPDSPLAQEEIFGPVLSIISAETIDEAIAIANNSIYALTGGIYSRSPHNIQKIRDELQVGNLYINRKITGAVVSRQPFGGYAMSGVGSKAGGPDYLLQFMNPRTITENTLRRGFAPSSDS
ncbi:MAG: aldehyde dehydrogenase family protein, partial [Spirochaetota bacterium]|nr:aldehyde dehydrogenase family protein [Spirochaetota bacterium]